MNVFVNSAVNFRKLTCKMNILKIFHFTATAPMTRESSKITSGYRNGVFFKMSPILF